MWNAKSWYIPTEMWDQQHVSPAHFEYNLCYALPYKQIGSRFGNKYVVWQTAINSLRWRHNGHDSQITSLTIVYSIVYSDADQRKHQSFASLAVVRGIHRGPVNSPHKWPVTWKMFPFDDVIMLASDLCYWLLRLTRAINQRLNLALLPRW